MLKLMERIAAPVTIMTFHNGMTLQGYSMYITVFYVLVAVVWAIVALTVWVALQLRKDSAGVWLNR